MTSATRSILLLCAWQELRIAVRSRWTQIFAGSLAASKTVTSCPQIGLFVVLSASQAIGFGAAGVILFVRVGSDGILAFLVVVGGSLALTAVFLCLAAAIAGGDTSAHRARTLAVGLVCWFMAVVLFDVAALGVASVLPSGLASRVLMTAAIANPVDAVRTATLLMAEGTTAFGGASLAFLRFVGGSRGAALWPIASLVVWTIALLAIASTRLKNADI